MKKARKLAGQSGASAAAGVSEHGDSATGTGANKRRSGTETPPQLTKVGREDRSKTDGLPSELQ